jgi:hypothetical protein
MGRRGRKASNENKRGNLGDAITLVASFLIVLFGGLRHGNNHVMIEDEEWSWPWPWSPVPAYTYTQQTIWDVHGRMMQKKIRIDKCVDLD